ncbi:uncharacterized protein LOC132193462 [Neocloeon triangulifer]|uniref:uncharacterized protein LOC132193462 n=1 Tax=Neocloeon triangulifer TaxID=2078957 RepID=UPI00286F7214|nr:uncharacterized protein LOC132193462 [Neocloeon triangulifer]
MVQPRLPAMMNIEAEKKLVVVLSRLPSSVLCGLKTPTVSPLEASSVSPSTDISSTSPPLLTEQSASELPPISGSNFSSDDDLDEEELESFVAENRSKEPLISYPQDTATSLANSMIQKKRKKGRNHQGRRLRHKTLKASGLLNSTFARDTLPLQFSTPTQGASRRQGGFVPPRILHFRTATPGRGVVLHNCDVKVDNFNMHY